MMVDENENKRIKGQEKAKEFLIDRMVKTRQRSDRIDERRAIVKSERRNQEENNLLRYAEKVDMIRKTR